MKISYGSIMAEEGVVFRCCSANYLPRYLFHSEKIFRNLGGNEPFAPGRIILSF